MDQSNIPNVVVFYHHPCHDGFLAQTVLRKLLEPHANVTSYPMQHGTPLDIEGIFRGPTEVLFVDIAPSVELIESLVNNELVVNVHVWDHHIDYRNRFDHYSWDINEFEKYFDVTMETARIGSKLTLWFCNEISGSKLACIAAAFWIGAYLEPFEFLRPAVQLYEHPIVVHASDYDTWKKVYPNTDFIFDAYRFLSYDDQSSWDRMLDSVKSFECSGYSALLSKGRMVRQTINDLVARCTVDSELTPIKWKDSNGSVYNGLLVTASEGIISEICHAVIERTGCDFVIAFRMTNDNLKLSIRSKDGVPANRIAQSWGGGGHARAAGAGMTGNQARDWIRAHLFPLQLKIV